MACQHIELQSLLLNPFMMIFLQLFQACFREWHSDAEPSESLQATAQRTGHSKEHVSVVIPFHATDYGYDA